MIKKRFINNLKTKVFAKKKHLLNTDKIIQETGFTGNVLIICHENG